MQKTWRIGQGAQQAIAMAAANARTEVSRLCGARWCHRAAINILCGRRKIQRERAEATNKKKINLKKPKKENESVDVDVWVCEAYLY